MRKFLLVAGAALSLVAATAMADKVRDVHELEAVHQHIMESINELNRARAGNHYDMAGHGEKAEKLLHDAEKELREGIEAARHAK